MSKEKDGVLPVSIAQEGYTGGAFNLQEGYTVRPSGKQYLATSGYRPKKDAPPDVQSVKFVPKNPPKAD